MAQCVHEGLLIRDVALNGFQSLFQELAGHICSDRVVAGIRAVRLADRGNESLLAGVSISRIPAGRNNAHRLARPCSQDPSSTVVILEITGIRTFKP